MKKEEEKEEEAEEEREGAQHACEQGKGREESGGGERTGQGGDVESQIGSFLRGIDPAAVLAHIHLHKGPQPHSRLSRCLPTFPSPHTSAWMLLCKPALLIISIEPAMLHLSAYHPHL